MGPTGTTWICHILYLLLWLSNCQSQELNCIHQPVHVMLHPLIKFVKIYTFSILLLHATPTIAYLHCSYPALATPTCPLAQWQPPPTCSSGQVGHTNRLCLCFSLHWFRFILLLSTGVPECFYKTEMWSTLGSNRAHCLKNEHSF